MEKQKMMFQSLEAFRGQLNGLSIAINFTAGQQQFVMVTPVVAEDAKTKHPELAQPFSFTASAAELDSEFGKAISELASSRKSIAEQVAAQAAALKAKAASSAAKPVATAGKVATKAPKVSIDDDDDVASSAVVAEPIAATAAPTAPAAAADLTAANLFE